MWGAVNEEALLLQVRVADDAHHTPAADDPQAGDSVVVTVDALGDTDLSTDAPAHGFDDLSVAFASVDGAAVADVTAGAAAGGRHGEMMPQVIRDDAPGVTTYRLRIPWRETRAYPAVGESMQLRVTVRDTDPGRDAPADQTTTLRLSFGMPMLRFAGTAVTRPTAAGPDGYAEVRLMVFSPTALVHATFGNADQTLDLTDPGTGPAFRRYAIRAYPGATSTGSTPLTLTVTEAGATLTRLEHEVHTAATTMPTTGRSER